MKKIIYVLIAGISIGYTAKAQEKTIQEKLGYPKDSKLLIIHADDLGVSHSENLASIQAMEKGSVNSASILVPCPWLSEISAYAKSHPDADLGLHLALTSEWKYYKWGSVAPRDEVKSLMNEQGYFYDNVPEVLAKANVSEAEKELRAQIEHALKVGINPTHFDAHMGAVVSSPALLAVYVKLAEEYKVPVLFNADLAKIVNNKTMVTLDKILSASPEDFKQGMAAYYTKVIKELQPGLSELIIHTAFDDAEMQAVTLEHPEWGAAWRQADFDFFTSDVCKKLLADEKIQLVTWKEIRDKIIRKKQ